MKIKVENVRTWVPQGSRNGPQNHLKIDEKTHLVTASAAKAHFGVPGSIWGYPPWRKRLQKHTKKRIQKYQNTWTNLSKTKIWKAPSSAKSPGARRSGRSPPGYIYIYIYIHIHILFLILIPYTLFPILIPHILFPILIPILLPILIPILLLKSVQI